MPKPFDATLKGLIVSRPADWLRQLGVPVTAEPEILSVDLSTVTAAADALIKVGDLVVHIDLESGPDDSLARRMLLYNVLAHHRTGLPVHSIVVLLRANAVGRSSDAVEYAPRPGKGELRFRFETVKAWELPSEEVLNAGIGFLPLAVLGKPPVGQTREQALPAIVARIAERTAGEPQSGIDLLLTAAYVLSTMHFAPSVASAIFNRVIGMKDLPGYQFIMEEGAIDHTRQIILKQGHIRFGEPDEKQKNKLAAIEDLARLDRIAVEVLRAKDWDALLRTQ